jgi:glycosyltransferase involved in cell wall biosynthesis
MQPSGGRHAGPDATIVIPTKDRPDDVRRAVNCALDQRGVSVEVVVVDDGSRTPVGQTLGDLTIAAAGRLRIVRNPAPTGVSNARNRGIEAARGPWVGFCDDDDMWAPNKVRTQLDVSDESIGWSVSAAVKMDETFRVFQRQDAPDPATVADRILAANVIPGGASSVLVRAELIRELGGFDPAFSTLADWDLWARLASAAPLASVDEPLVAYLVQADSMSADTGLLGQDLDRFLAKHRPRREERDVPFDWANWHRYVGDMELRAQRRVAASRNYWAASRLGHPTAWKVGIMAALSPGRARARLHGERRQRLDAVGLEDAQAWIREVTAPAPAPLVPRFDPSPCFQPGMS